MALNADESQVHGASGGGERQAVVFRMASESYGIDIFRVHEIIRMREVTPVPRSKTHIRGLVNLRGNTVPVVDLATRLGLERADESPDTRIIVVESESGDIGLIVDAVTEVVNLGPEKIEQTPDFVAERDTGFIKGIAHHGGRLITLLDLDRTLAA
ncbi:MAG TPA: chemotaxis protein CheW [Fimbriimonadaceae bacterium]|nr:chemotaxis protein CheW [Fimbriimonadaceae bacterium]